MKSKMCKANERAKGKSKNKMEACRKHEYNQRNKYLFIYVYLIKNVQNVVLM